MKIFYLLCEGSSEQHHRSVVRFRLGWPHVVGGMGGGGDGDGSSSSSSSSSSEEEYSEDEYGDDDFE